MEKIKNYKAFALFAAGLFVAAGFTVQAQAGGLETIKDAVIALTAKILNIETRVIALEENAKLDTDAVGGVTAFDQLDVAWIETGDVASTTDGTWNAQVRLELISADGVDEQFWRNDTGGNAWVSADLLDVDMLGGVATSPMDVYVATSTDQHLTDYTHKQSAPSALLNQSDNLLRINIATSTADFTLRATSTHATLIRPGDYVVLKILTENHICVGGEFVQTGAGHCEGATSTTRGIDINAVLNVFATSTPKQQSF